MTISIRTFEWAMPARLVATGAFTLALGQMVAVWAKEGDLAANEQIEASAVTSPRQAGSLDQAVEKEPVDAPPVLFEAQYKADLLTGLNGPLRHRGAYVGNLDLKLTVAGEKAFSLPGSTVFLHLIHDHGSKPNSKAGTDQGIDNIEVATNTGKVHQLWWQQQFFGDRLSLLGGLYDSMPSST